MNTLERQIEEWEVELESMVLDTIGLFLWCMGTADTLGQGGRGGKGRKNERTGEIAMFTSRHKWHVGKMEQVTCVHHLWRCSRAHKDRSQVLRLLDNGSLSSSRVDDVKVCCGLLFRCEVDELNHP